MTYADRLAEFVKVTGHKPGEMNKIQQGVPRLRQVSSVLNDRQASKATPPTLSLEPPAQSAGPGRCSLKYCGKPCVLADGHAGAHEL